MKILGRNGIVYYTLAIIVYIVSPFVAIISLLVDKIKGTKI